MQKLTWAPPCTSRPSRRCRPGPAGRQCPEHRDTSAPAPPPAPGTWHTVETCHSVTGLGVGLTWAPARLWRRESCRPVSGGWLASPHWPAHSVLQTHCSAAGSRGQRVTSAVSPPARDPPPGTQYRGRRTSGGSGTRSSCCSPDKWEESQITWSWLTNEGIITWPQVSITSHSPRISESLRASTPSDRSQSAPAK